MIVRSLAPLRLGLAGGGSDVSPYADVYGGSILNATINLHAHASIEPTSTNRIELFAADQNTRLSQVATEQLEINGELDLLKGVYNRVVRDFTNEPLSFKLTTYVDAPAGSGLGSSSTLVVAILGAFVEWLNLPLGEYDIAHLAYDIERNDLKLSGGRQDQYAATFGGFNFMEFYADDKVIVNPLRIRRKVIHEIQENLLLCYTGTSRSSAEIIDAQRKAVEGSQKDAVQATHEVKALSQAMKEAVLRGELNNIGKILEDSWLSKKRMAKGITTPEIDAWYDAAKEAGASGGKISGAGGGGYMFFYCPNNSKHAVMKALGTLGVQRHYYQFSANGLYSYTINSSP
jgi:D-glycero-alpha-D-manno-heptose-7-phosphate kinase